MGFPLVSFEQIPTSDTISVRGQLSLRRVLGQNVGLGHEPFVKEEKLEVGSTLLDSHSGVDGVE